MKSFNSFLRKLDIKSLVNNLVWIYIAFSIFNFAYYLWSGETTNLINTFTYLIMSVLFYAISIHLNKSYDNTIHEGGEVSQEINLQINDNIEEIRIKYDENNKLHVECTYKK